MVVRDGLEKILKFYKVKKLPTKWWQKWAKLFYKIKISLSDRNALNGIDKLLNI